jgi:2,3-bisphosphoglycerate-dependent phosphoglycerate mutase
MGYLILVRHGESRWNLTNRFTGWVDVPLSEKGLREAMAIAKSIRKLKLDVAFTSHLERAHETLLVALSYQHCTGIFIHEREHQKMQYPFKIGKDEIPVYSTWILNERNYGLLQGMNKREAGEKYGYDKVWAWRRNYNVRPPKGESLKEVYQRVIPYFKEKIFPEVRKKKNVLVVAHGNTLRTIIKYIDKISDEKISQLELPPAQAFVYRMRNGKLRKAFERYSFERPINWE